MSRALQNPKLSNAFSRQADTNGLSLCPQTPRISNAGSRVTALNVEFVAKPGEAHKVQADLPAAINSAFVEAPGFAGSFILIANHEERLVTIVILWSGEDRMRRCQESVRWVRALLAPYLDRCLRVQTLAAYIPGPLQSSKEFGQCSLETAPEAELNEQESLCVA
ncbi:MAG: hypothetical protein WBE13_10650 [Candidatus Acidiferrum sp.]